MNIKLSASLIFCVVLCLTNALSIIDVIKNGLKHTQIEPNEQVTLLMGLTGSGKTTLAKFLTEAKSTLVSVPIFDKFPVLKKYQIIDYMDDKISKNTSVPKTFYPEKYLDSLNAEVIIDCPSFDDSRSESDEIAIYVFLRNIFKLAKRVKFVIVVDADDVRPGGSSKNILKLLNHLAVLVKNFDECQNCVGMVVTKGKSKPGAQSAQEITMVAEFLKQVDNGSKSSEVRKILAGLLREGKNVYKHIGVFRQPQEEGQLSQIKAYTYEKFNLRTKVFKNLEFTSSKSKDFRSRFSKNNRSVYRMFYQTKKEIETILNNFLNEFFNVYSNTLRPIADYEEFQERLKTEITLFDRTKLEEIKTIQGQLKWFFDIITIHWPQAHLAPVQTLSKILSIIGDIVSLEDIMDDTLNTPPVNVPSVVADVDTKLTEWMNWSGFLLDTFERLTEYDMQREKSTLNFTTLTNWNNFKNFAFGVLKIDGHTTVRDKLELEKSQQFALEDMLRIIQSETTFRDLTPNSEKCELVMEGNFVLQSDLNQKSRACGRKSLSALRIFAKYTVFLDLTFEAIGEELLVGIIAPKWQVVNASTIILDGTATRTFNGPSTSGDGRAGMVGGPSGLFFGFVNDVINPEKLKISAKGGAGGDGEGGRNGTNGHGDIDVDAVFQIACVSKYYKYSCDTSSDYFEHNQIRYELDRLRCEYDCKGCCPVYFLDIKTRSGPEPTNGFRGGKPGLGGLHSKSSQLIVSHGDSKAILIAADGEHGQIGMGGKGGRGGYKNGRYKMDVVTTCKLGFFKINISGISRCDRGALTRGTPGTSGQDGPNNSSGTQIQPKPAIEHDTYEIISNYRLFAYNQMLNQESTFMASSQISFFDHIRRNPVTKKLINVTTLISEFISVEKLRRNQPYNPIWLDVYDILLHTVEASHSVESISRSSNFKAIAHFLSAAILSRRLDLEYQTDNNLVVDTSEFLKEVARQMEKFLVLDRNQKLNEIQSIYNQDILKKQREGENFINGQFHDEMTKVQAKIDASIEKLLNEVNELLENLGKDRKTLEENLKTAKTKMVFNIFFDVLKGFGVFATVLFPTNGSFIKSLIDYSTGIGGKFTGPAGEVTITKLPDILNKFEDQERKLQTEVGAKKNFLKRLLDTANVTQTGEKGVIEEAKSMLESLAAGISDIYKVQFEVHNIIKASKQKFNVTGSKELRRLQTAVLMSDIKEIEAYNKLYQATQTAISRSQRYREEIDKLEAQLQEVDESIVKANQYKQLVDNEMRSHLQNFASLMKSLIAGSSESSSVGLEISRFRIKDTFEDLKVQMNRFTAGFEANADIMSAINTMEYLMTTAINVYAQIQMGNDQINLGNLITNINRLGLLTFETNDTSLSNALEELEYTLMSNTIQNQYTRVVNSFKQLVFPFAPIFLDEIHISVSASTGEDGDDILKMMVTRLDRLHKSVNSLDTTIVKGYDDSIFTSGYMSFFGWEEAEYKDTITDLLNGKEVSLKTDVTGSFANAVKFSDIQLELIAKNGNDQKLLDTMLTTKNIKLTHMGHSQYKCGEKYFIITHQPQTIEYSYQKDAKGEPLESNNVFKKIKSGDILLSPYTLWKFQIVDKFTGRNDDVSQLYGQIKLSLGGRAQYVKLDNSICKQTSLESFYELDKITTANSKITNT